MAESLVLSRFKGNKTLRVRVPADATDALAFGVAVLDGGIEVYQKESESGSDVVTTAKKAFITVRQFDTNNVCEAQAYFSVLVKATADEKDIQIALTGKTLSVMTEEGVQSLKADRVAVRTQFVNYQVV